MADALLAAALPAAPRPAIILTSSRDAATYEADLARTGLPSAAARAAARRASVPAELAEAPERRFAPDVEAAAYYVVSEALANAGKYASAQVSIRESGGAAR